MDMIARLGALAIAAAMLFVALRLHKTPSRNPKKTKLIACVLAFFAGCAFMATFIGQWVAAVAAYAPGFVVAGLIVAAGIIAVDAGVDGTPDKPAFWASFVLPAFIVFGLAGLPQAGQMISDGVTQVSTQISQVKPD